MASKKAVQWAKKICKDNKVNYRFKKLKKILGYADSHRQYIVVSTTLDSDIFKSTILHEIAHCLNYRNKKYLKYHDSSRKSKGYLRRMALRAEVYTDDVAAKLAKKYKIKFYRAYTFNKASRNFLKEYYGF